MAVIQFVANQEIQRFANVYLDIQEDRMKEAAILSVPLIQIVRETELVQTINVLILALEDFAVTNHNAQP